jgi:hypothetical protein
MKRAVFFLACTVIILGLSGCSGPKQSPTVSAPPPKLPPTEFGVRTARTGEAVAELEVSLAEAFKSAMVLTSKLYEIRQERAPHRIEATNGSVTFTLSFRELSTGKTGMSILAFDKNKIDYLLARGLADMIAESIKNPARTDETLLSL